MSNYAIGNQLCAMFIVAKQCCWVAKLLAQPSNTANSRQPCRCKVVGGPCIAAETQSFPSERKGRKERFYASRRKIGIFLSACDCPVQCLAYWEKVKGAERWGPDWSLRSLAAAQRVQLSLSAFADNIYRLVQPHAESFK